MMLAPTPELTAVVRPMHAGIRGVSQTIRVMRQLVKEARVSPVIRQAATSIIFLSPEKVWRDEVDKLLSYVQSTIRYTQDVNDVETVSTPEKTLAGKVGDCDDQSALLAALCEAVGYPTRFVVAAYDDPAVMEHVYLQVCVDGLWLDADPTERHPLGWAPPDALSLMIEKV